MTQEYGFGDEAAVRATQPPPEIPRTREQIQRIDAEWRALQRHFAFHPHVRVIPLSGFPPCELQVKYNLRTLILDEAGDLQYGQKTSVHVWLPPGFPQEPPLVRPISPIFHPNITADGIDLIPPWDPDGSLAALVAAVGAMLAFQSYNTESAANETALAWVEANEQLLPLDLEAEFAEDAGGPPLQRIARTGPKTIEYIRSRLLEMRDALTARRAPAPPQVKAFCAKTRLALQLFLAPDISLPLRKAAEELDADAREIADTVETWDTLQRQQQAAAAAGRLSETLATAQQQLALEMRAIDCLVRDVSPTDPFEVLQRIPTAGTLQHHQGELLRLIALADAALAGARSQMASLNGNGLDATAGGRLLGEKLKSESEQTRTVRRSARDRMSTEVSRVEALQQRAQAVADGLQRIVDWRAYADQVQKATELVRKITEWGPAAIQAYFIENEAGRFGPFDFEAKLTMGAISMIGRCSPPSVMEILDAESLRTMERADSGFVTMTVSDPQTGGNFTMACRLTGRCDELAVQLDYIIQQTTDTLQRLVGRIDAGDTWVTHFINQLGGAEAHAALSAALDESQAVWRSVCDDLQQLYAFKNRLATYHLIHRISEAAKQTSGQLAEGRKTLAQTDARLAEIVSKCSYDLQTDRLQVPAKFAKEYAELLRRRDTLRADLPKLQAHLAILAADLQPRISDAEQVGLPVIPMLGSLGALPAEVLALEPHLSDESLRQALAELEGPLGQSFELLSAYSPPEPEAPAETVEEPVGEEAAQLARPPQPVWPASEEAPAEAVAVESETAAEYTEAAPEMEETSGEPDGAEQPVADEWAWSEDQPGEATAENDTVDFGLPPDAPKG